MKNAKWLPVVSLPAIRFMVILSPGLIIDVQTDRLSPQFNVLTIADESVHIYSSTIPQIELYHLSTHIHSTVLEFDYSFQSMF